MCFHQNPQINFSRGQGYHGASVLCPDSDKQRLLLALRQDHLVHFVGHNGPPPNEQDFECCAGGFLLPGDVTSAKSQFVYGSFCNSSHLGEVLTQKGVGSFVGWNGLTSDVEGYLYSNEFYAWCFLKGYSVEDAKAMTACHHGRDADFVLHGNPNLTL